jgi:hypothetical protein
MAFGKRWDRAKKFQARFHSNLPNDERLWIATEGINCGSNPPRDIARTLPVVVCDEV